MSETDESGNRWETKSPRSAPTDWQQPAGADESAGTTAAPAEADPIEMPSAPAATEAAGPAAESRASRLPRWVTRSGLVTAGAAAAIFLGGGGFGYAIGANHDGGGNAPQSRFDRAGFNDQGPGGRFPGDDQAPGGGQGQGQSQGQSQGDGSSSSSGTGS
ncbi:MAG: hypothetical protein ACJ72D_03020 [Marmoricola sp.]